MRAVQTKLATAPEMQKVKNGASPVVGIRPASKMTTIAVEPTPTGRARIILFLGFLTMRAIKDRTIAHMAAGNAPSQYANIQTGGNIDSTSEYGTHANKRDNCDAVKHELNRNAAAPIIGPMTTLRRRSSKSRRLGPMHFVLVRASMTSIQTLWPNPYPLPVNG